MSIGSLFGSERLLRLRSAIVVGNLRSTTTRTLTAADFAKLSVVEKLRLNQLGIVDIEPNTFDFIGMTLREIYLHDNLLKHIQARWFAEFFDKQWLYNRKMIYYQYNPLECDCDFYEMRNLTLFMRLPHGYYPLEDDSWELTHECFGQNPMPVCVNLQEIRRDKLHVTDTPVETFAYPKVNLRIDNDILIALTNYTMTFRILLQKYNSIEIRKRTRCPSPQWLRENVLCWMLPGEKKRISVAQFIQESSLTTFLAILIDGHKRVWPLHIQTIRRITQIDTEPIFIALNVWGFICAGFTSGFILVYLWNKVRPFIGKMPLGALHGLR